MAVVKDASCGSRYVGHGGDTPGYHTQALYFPDKKATIVVTVDSDAVPTGSTFGVT